MAITRLLIANRGEIALRIHRAAHEMGIETGIDLGHIIALAGQLRGWVGHADSAVLKAGTCADLVPLSSAKKQG